MSDLIDRKAFRDQMYHEAFETNTTMQRWDSGCWIRWKLFENILKKQPLVDAEPVMLAEWIEHKDYPGLAYLCSACSYFTTNRSYYCPYCGKKMGGSIVMSSTNLTVPLNINWKGVEGYEENQCE